jgi:hypothetical protein
MSGGGGSSQPTSSTVTNVTIPPYLKDSILDIAGKAKALADVPYQEYDKDRVAQTTAQQQQARQGIMGLQRPGEFDPARQTFMAGTQYQYNPGEFGQAEAQKYMNPYQQNVINMAVRDAQREGARQSAMANLQAGKFGGTGSSGQAIMQAAIARKMPELVGDITSKGMQQAYLNAQEQFQRDRQANTQANQFAAELQQKSGMGLMDLGKTVQASDLARLATQEDVGGREQRQRQLELDVAYQDWMRQSEYDKEMLKFYNDIVRGNAFTLGSAETSYAPSPSFAGQLLGGGVSAAGIYNAFKGDT